jgi:hypothetical protein
MKRILSYTAVIVALGLTASTAFSQTTANGPYYATPSWDQTLPASTRFIVLSNMASAAVLDRETGLVWEKVPRTDTLNWVSASAHCLSQETGGRKGWRLPALTELNSLVDRSQVTPALPSGHPFTVQSSFYWSATTTAANAADAWLVELLFGGAGPLVKTNPNNGLAWCVRGGPGGDTQ